MFFSSTPNPAKTQRAQDKALRSLEVASKALEARRKTFAAREEKHQKAIRAAEKHLVPPTASDRRQAKAASKFASASSKAEGLRKGVHEAQFRYEQAAAKFEDAQRVFAKKQSQHQVALMKNGKKHGNHHQSKWEALGPLAEAGAELSTNNNGWSWGFGHHDGGGGGHHGGWGDGGGASGGDGGGGGGGGGS